MATRQYIGARYVIKIYENSVTAGSAEWEANTSYEPLTMVTYQNSSYLSKKAVPATVGNPASNTDYWVVTGAYNGQIASLQSQINDANLSISALTTEINKLEHLANRKIMLLMDSYGGRRGSNNLSINEIVARNTGAQCSLLYESGGGLYNDRIRTMVDNYSGSDADEYDTVIYIGGANDLSQLANESTIFTNMGTLVSSIKTKFSNVENILVMCAGIIFDSSQYNVSSFQNLARIYKQSAIRFGAKYVYNSEYIFRNTELLDVDKTHPIIAGVDALAEFVCQALIYNTISVDYVLYATATTTDGTADSVLYKMVRHNGTVKMTCSGATGRFALLKDSRTYDFSTINFATLDNTLVESLDTRGYTVASITGTVKVSSDYIPIRGGVYIENSVIKCNIGPINSIDDTVTGTYASLVGDFIIND